MAARKSTTVLFNQSPNDQGWLSAIHAVVLRIGRHMGFQAFNVDSRSEKTGVPVMTPATIFLVTDHLHHLLVKNYMRRDKAAGSDDDHFERAVYRLHAGIFQGYSDWCRHVELPEVTPELRLGVLQQQRGPVLEWEYKLEELALYFLIYSEASSLRHMPEFLWFIYWVVRNSRHRLARVTGIPANDSRSACVAAHSEAHKNVTKKQLHLRNKYHKEIVAWRNELGTKADGEYKKDADLEEVLSAARRKISPLFKGATMEVDLLVDMVAYGDSGAFLDRIVEPVFSYLAVQVDKLGTSGREIGARAAYDDCNEALSSKDSVHKVLRNLGLKVDVRRRSLQFLEGQDPYDTLLEIGEKRVNIVATDGKKAMPIAPSATLGWGWEDARNWWAKFVFGKTFVERRSFMTMYRAFFRVWVFLILQFQAMAVCLWAWGDWYALSSLCLTHAGCCLLEQVAAAWTQRRIENDIRVLGNPFWGRHAKGILDWIIINAVLYLCLVAQITDFIEGVDIWWYCAGGYAALVILHAVSTQRDGYCISWSYTMGGLFRKCYLIPIAWIFEFFGSSSARPPAKQYLKPYDLKVGWGNYLSNMLFWVLVIGCKLVFDWFAVFQPLKDSVIALWDANWLGTVGSEWQDTDNDPSTPPEKVETNLGWDLDIILCIGRCLPGFLVVMNDMQVFYYIIGGIFGAMKGLFQLNLGSVTSFQDLVVAFHKSSTYWWKRGMSGKGITNLEQNIAQALTPDPALQGAGQYETLGDLVRIRNQDRENKLVTDQLIDATKELTARMARSDSTVTRLHLQDTDLPRWLAFSVIWNSIVDELREIDLISNAEMENLKFIDITIDETVEVVEGMRPIMLPIFFYGGQVARALEHPGDDPAQGLVLTELRALVTFLLVQTGIIDRDQMEAIVQFEPVAKPVNLEHRTKRTAAVGLGLTYLKTVKELQGKCADRMSTYSRFNKAMELRETMQKMFDMLDYEIKVVLQKDKSPLRGPTDNNASRLRHTKAARLKEELERFKSQRLDFHDWNAWLGQEGGLDHIFDEAPETTAKSNIRKVVNHAIKMLTVTAKGAQPRGEEAQRVLAFFMASLKNPTMEQPPAVDDMLSWNVLTPHYEEDVLYALSSAQVADHFNMSAAAAKGITDLMSENDDGVTVMAWLRSNYPREWENLMERLGPKLRKANIDPKLVKEADFAEGGPLQSCQMELLHWASFKGQLLARTVRGMMVYERGLRLLANLENPNPGNTLRYNAAVDDLVRSKFSYIVASQRYGDNRGATNPKGRWLARGVDILLHEHPGLRVAFLESQATAKGKQQHSVLVRARLGTPVTDENCTEELYRIRLPINHTTDHGIILGEGKPENQNASIIYAFGEVVQAIDMNQDNYLCEALKMRNLINEFNPPSYTDATARVACAVGSGRKAGRDAVAIPVGPGLAETQGRQVGSYMYERPFPDCANQPVVLVGFREWIFSQDSGALASFAAATEFTFGSMIQRIMTWPGGVRFHYGHPDLWNKIWIMTRGGVSKATRAFHISEDVFAGYNHVLRGGRVKFKEYISVGKGRDMGFDSINSFESKVSSGNGEQVMSRDVHRLSTQFDFFRLLSFYHSGPGFFINSYLVLLSVYVNMWMLIMLALTDTQTLASPTEYDQTINTLTGQATSVAVQQVVQIGMFSVITFVLEMILEYGAVKALATLFTQLIQGSLAFFIFRSRTTAYFFINDVMYGGAKYIPTGRGYQLKHNSFVKVYSNYARSHLYYAFELLLLLILLALNDPEQYAATTWSTWMVCISILWAPFWFNPGSFVLEKTKDDFESWLLWMSDVVDPETGTTWEQWNKGQLEKPRNDKHNQTNPFAGAIRGVLSSIPTAILTLGAISSLEETRWNKWLVFAVWSGAFWLFMIVLSYVYRWMMRNRHYRLWRLTRTLAFFVIVAFIVCSIIFIPAEDSGIGVKNIVLIMFANFSAIAVVTQFLLYLGRSSLGLRAVVDQMYRILDWICGYFLFLILFLLSLLMVVDTVQTALLYNIKFARTMEQARLMGTNYVTAYVDRATERISNKLKKDLERGGMSSSRSSETLKQA